MTLGLAIVISLVGGLASIALAPRLPRAAAGIGILAAAAVLVLGFGLRADDSLLIGGVALASADPVRLVTVGWSGGLLLLALIGLATGEWAMAIGGGLMALGAALVAISVDQTTVAFAALAIGGVAAVAVPALAGWLGGLDDDPPLDLLARALGVVAGAGLLAIVVVAWSQSSTGPLGEVAAAGDQASALRTAVGLATVGMAAIVLFRSGAIPAHLWAARLVGAITPLAIPLILAWGSAVFVLVAVGWSRAALAAGPLVLDDLDRWIVILFALASLLLGGLAAMLHDDLEHVLAYSIVQDAGVALLAFASLKPDFGDPLATWLIASAALKTALAGWIAVTRWAFGTHRVSELGGWARRAPLLGVTYAILLLGSVGVPGMAIFDARVALVSAALPGSLGTLVIVAALSPLLALGRLLAVGLGRLSLDVAAARNERIGRLVASFGGWTRGGPRWWLKAGAAVIRANKGLGAGVTTVLLAVLGLAIAIFGAASPTSG